MRPPAITLLIPCYNAAAFLPRLMSSVRVLTQPFAAILCYDDGSRDNTLAVARGLGLEIIAGGANRGVAPARNALAAAAKTEWIHFHDADDLIAPAFLDRLAPHCDDQHDVVSCDADWIDEPSGRVLIRWRYDPTALSADAHNHLLTHPMGLNNSIIRRSAWERVGGCDASLAMWEDADVHIRLARDSARFHHVPEVLTQSLRRGESFSHNYRANWTWRLQALEGYAAAASSDSIRATLASETEHAAAELALLGAKPTALRALALCRRLGGHPPSTAHPLLRLLKRLVPAYSLLVWQARRRRAASSS